MEKIKNKQIKYRVQPNEQHWVGDGFYVHTLIHPSTESYRYTSPFLLMDYAPPREFSKSNTQRGVGEHPHRGFETVTLALAGEVEHRDSSGAGGVISSGDIQWMTAAKGLVHEEFHSKEFSKRGGIFEMVQLWVNIPKEYKMSPPKYQGIKDADFPKVNSTDGVEVKVIAGEYMGHNAPTKTFTPINMYLVTLNSETNLNVALSTDTNTILLVLSGGIQVNEENFKEKSLLVFDRRGNNLNLKTVAESKVLILNSEPLDEPIAACGPFVMSTKQELIEAFEDYRSGKMGKL